MPNVICAKRIASSELHPTEKPVGVYEPLIRVVTKPGHTVLDPFMGSGTAGVAAALLGRKFIGIETEPRYFDIACKRIEEATAQAKMLAPVPNAVQESLL